MFKTPTPFTDFLGFLNNTIVIYFSPKKCGSAEKGSFPVCIQILK
jgi:hypothetical protein